MQTTIKAGWQYEVTDGTKARPMGYVGTFNTRKDAETARSQRCRMGGYIKRVPSGRVACPRCSSTMDKVARACDKCLEATGR